MADLVGERVVVRSATPVDLPAVESLLTSSHLPLDGAGAAFATGYVAIDDNGETVGCVALEVYGEAALLRSVAVSETHRGRRIGRELVAAAEAAARRFGVSEVYLLTEAAASWFEALGYQRLGRGEVPPAVAASVEFAVACPDTAVAMHRPLTRPV